MLGFNHRSKHTVGFRFSSFKLQQVLHKARNACEKSQHFQYKPAFASETAERPTAQMNLLEVGLDEQSQILCIDGLDVVLVHSDQITVLPAGFLNKAN